MPEILNYLDEACLQDGKKERRTYFLREDSKFLWYQRHCKPEKSIGTPTYLNSFIIPVLWYEPANQRLREIILKKLKEILPALPPDINDVSVIRKHLKKQFIDEISSDDQQRQADAVQKIIQELDHLKPSQTLEVLSFIQKIKQETNAKDGPEQIQLESRDENKIKTVLVELETDGVEIDVTTIEENMEQENKEKDDLEIVNQESNMCNEDESSMESDPDIGKLVVVEIDHKFTQTDLSSISGLDNEVRTIQDNSPNNEDMNCVTCQKLRTALDHSISVSVPMMKTSTLVELLAGESVSDDIVNKYSRLIRKNNSNNIAKCFIFDNTVFGTFKKKLAWNNFVSKFIGQEYDFFAFPIQLQKIPNWILIVYKVSGHSFHCYDSQNSSQDFIISAFESKCQAIVLSFLEKTCKTKPNNIAPLIFEQEFCEQDFDLMDSGVYVLQLIKHIALQKNIADVTKEEIVKSRQEMYDELVNNELE